MNENFTVIYHILRLLERAMDEDAFDWHEINPQTMGVSQQRLNRIVEILVDEGFVKGVRVSKDAAGFTYIDTPDPQITLAGLRYLAENSLAQRALKQGKNIRDLMP